MDYAKRIGQVGALAVVLGVGAAVTTHAIGSAAPTDPSSSSTDSPVDACSPLGGSASSLAAIPGASVPQVGVRQVDPGSIPDDLLNALIDFLAAVRNGLVPIIENRTPVANPQQVSVPEGGTVGPVRFDACDPDGNRMTFAVRERGAPGGPQHGIVTVDQRTASFIYTADPGFVGTDTFSVNVSDDTSLHVHGLAGYLGPFHGHDDVATVTVFVGNTPTDTISGDFSMLTYNIAGLPFPLSSAILPRFFYTKEQPAAEVAVHQQRPHIAEGDPLTYQVFDVDATVAQGPAVFVRLGDLGRKGHHAVEAGDEILRDHCHTRILTPGPGNDATGWCQSRCRR